MANEQAPGKRRRLIIIALICLIALGIGVKYFFFNREFRFAGTLEATKVELSARISSAIEAVNVQEGAHLTVGQVLVTLLCDDVKVASGLANTSFERSSRLSKAGTVSQEAFDQAKNRKEDADIRMSWCSIRSPIAGTVLSRYHEPGELVAPGTKLLTLANIREIWTYIYVPQPEVSRLKPGMKLIGLLPELKDRRFTGVIEKINSEAEFTPKNVQTQAERARLVFGVKISFGHGSNDDETLKPGMTIEVELPKE